MADGTGMKESGALFPRLVSPLFRWIFDIFVASFVGERPCSPMQIPDVERKKKASEC